MNNGYSDIRSRIPEQPKWWDEYAVPRYCDFGPDEVADIYARTVVLALIECQACSTEFRVAFSEGSLGDGNLAKAIGDKTLHYGDPPNACEGLCLAGATMNSVPRRVLEYWDKDPTSFDWVRHPEYEVDITPDWAAERVALPVQPEHS